MNKKNLISLIELYDEFENKEQSEDLEKFALWLTQKTKEKNEKDEVSINRMISYLINRLTRYARFYTKKSLEGMEINTIDEFYFLNEIMKRKTPSKNEVYSATITELTTGAQIMKRLITLGLVEEFSDDEDKRVKRVKLTEKGIAIRYEIFGKIQEDARLKLGNIDIEQKKQLLDILEKLEDFHLNIYENAHDKSIKEILEKYIF